MPTAPAGRRDAFHHQVGNTFWDILRLSYKAGGNAGLAMSVKVATQRKTLQMHLPTAMTAKYFPRSKNSITFLPSLAILAQRDFLSGFCSSRRSPLPSN